MNSDTGQIPATGRLWARWFVLTVAGQYAGMVAGWFGGFAAVSLAFSTVPVLPDVATVPSVFEPLFAMLVVGIGVAAALYGLCTGLAQRIAVPVPELSWLVTTTLASAGTAMLAAMLLVGWMSISSSPLVNQVGMVAIASAGGAAYGVLTSLPLRPVLVRRRPWIVATTLSAAISAAIIAYFTYTNLPLVAIALVTRPLLDAAITATGLSLASEP